MATLAERLRAWAPVFRDGRCNAHGYFRASHLVEIAAELEQAALVVEAADHADAVEALECSGRVTGMSYETRCQTCATCYLRAALAAAEEEPHE